ncbi:Terminase, ATPase subunit (GpP) [Escherichia coli]|nr:Terminase, ATPase subunit (GpP) [Escherichia coli]
MCEFVREGESAFNLNILIGCGVDGYDDWKDWKPFAPARWGIVRYGLGMTQTAAVETATAALCPWWFLRLFLEAVFERWRRDAFRGWSFEEQARVIEEFTCRYNVEHIGIDVTGGNGEAVYQIVKRFFPAAIPYTFTLSSKRSLVLKMLQIMRAGRWEYDRAERELVAAFNAVRKVKTPGGFITYETDRARGISHGDLAWATMLAVINEPIGGEGENERFTVMEF